MEFTFGILTYNHQEFILELLQSIRYQVLHYGSNWNINLVISDDCSNDKTVFLCEKWVEANRKIFNQVEIIQSENNQGVVENFKRIMTKVQSEYFKVIAGDDVFANNNVFDCVKGEDENALVTYIPIVLREGELSLNKSWYTKHYSYAMKKRSHRYDVKKQEMGSYFYTPCTFYRRKLYTKYYEGCPTFLRLFEDDPLWHALLVKNDKATVVFKNDFMVLYRMHDNAISSTKKSPYAKEMDKELIKFKKQIIEEERNIGVKISLWLQIHRPKNKYFYLINYKTVFGTWRRNIVCRYNKKWYNDYMEKMRRLEEISVYYQNIRKEALVMKQVFEREARKYGG